jgi:hypothetical protein
MFWKNKVSFIALAVLVFTNVLSSAQAISLKKDPAPEVLLLLPVHDFNHYYVVLIKPLPQEKPKDDFSMSRKEWKRKQLATRDDLQE